MHCFFKSSLSLFSCDRLLGNLLRAVIRSGFPLYLNDTVDDASESVASEKRLDHASVFFFFLQLLCLLFLTLQLFVYFEDLVIGKFVNLVELCHFDLTKFDFSK